MPLFLFVFLLLMTLAEPSSAYVPFAPNTAPHVQTNSALQQACIGTLGCPQQASNVFPEGVWRDDFATGNGAPPLFYRPSTTACAHADNGAQVASADGKCWIAQFPAGGADIRQWGADQTSTADSTAAVNAAIATGLPLLVPVGQFKITTLNSPLQGQSITGVSPYTSQFFTTSTTGDVLPINNPYVTLTNVGIIATGTSRTSGCHIHISSGYAIIFRYYLGSAYCAIKEDDNTSSNFIDQGFILNSEGSGQDVVIFGSGTGTGLVASYFGHTIINSATPTNNNIALYNVGDVLLDHIQSIGSVIDLKIAPGNGQNVVTLKCLDSYFDHGGTNMSVTATGSGFFGRSSFDNCWFGTSTANGALLSTDATAVIDGIVFNNCQFLLSAGSGLDMSGNVKNIAVTGGSIVAGNVDGIYDARNAGYNNVTVTGNTIGAGGGVVGNATGYQIGGGGDYLKLMNNNMQGNTGSAYSSSNSQTHNVIAGNSGYNPIGASVPTVGPSPFAYSVGPNSGTLYVFGGTISSIAINGTVLLNSAGSPTLIIPFTFNDVVVITYTAAPTMHAVFN